MATYEFDTLLAELERDEGYRRFVYKCSAGKDTVGIGRNLVDVGISRPEAQYLAINDVKRMEAELDIHLPWWRQLDGVRQRAMLNWAFNIGVKENDGKLLTFTGSLPLLRDGKWDAAAENLKVSKWAKQVGQRAVRVINMLRTGKDQADG